MRLYRALAAARILLPLLGVALAVLGIRHGPLNERWD